MTALFAAVVSRWLGLPRFVARAALMAAAFHVVFVGGVTVIKSGTNALFLARAEPSLLALLYAVTAVVVTIATAVLTRLLATRALKQVFGDVIIFNALLLMVMTAAVFYEVPHASTVLYVLGEATATTGSVLFWSRLMDGFTSRDQKRVVGIVAAGGMVGAAAGGLIMRVLVEFTGVALPMCLGAAAWIVALPLLRVLRARSVGTDDAHDDVRKQVAPYKDTRKRQQAPLATTEALRALFAAGYPRAVAALVVVFAATGAASDFVFRAASAQTGNERELAGLFGLLNAVVGVVVVFLQVGLTSRLLARAGVFVFAAIVPTLLVVLSLLYAVLTFTSPDSPWAFRVLLTLKGTEMAGAYSLHPVVVALLYNPIAPELRAQSRALIDGAIKKMGAAAAGLGLGMFASVGLLGGAHTSIWTVLVTAAAALALLPTLRRLYVKALEARVQTPVAHKGVQLAIDPTDKDTREALEHGLRSDDSEDVLAALSALGPTYELADDVLLLLLEHDSERVRATALARVPRRPDDRLAARLLEIAKTPGARRPRAEAVRALARVQPGKAADVVADFLDDDEPGVVAAALFVILRSRADARARQRLRGLLDDLPTHGIAWRRELARLLGVLRDARYGPSVALLMNDVDQSVRVLAVEAAAARGDPAHVDALIQKLDERETRVAVTSALIRFGDTAVPALASALDDKSLPVAVRVRVPRLLERIGSEAAAQALLYSNPRDDAYLQTRIAKSLVRIVERAPGTAVDRKRTDEAIGRHLVAYAAYNEALGDLYADRSAPFGLLRRVVSDRRKQNLVIALELLGVHRGIDRMRVIARGLLDRRKQSHLDAIELLDAALVADPLRADFLSLLDVREGVHHKEAALARAKRLTTSKDPMLRAVAHHTLVRQGVVLHDPITEGVGLPGSFELEGDDMADPLVERMFLLEDVDLFRGLEAADLLAIASLATELTIDAGQTVYHEGDLGNDNLYVIVEGTVELTRQGKAVMTLNAGESAGQVSFVDKGPRPVTCRVADNTPARFLVVEREQFFDLMADRTSLMHGFFDVLARRMRTLITKAAHDDDPPVRAVTKSS